MLKELRAFLRRNGVNAIIIAHDDDYQNEELSPDKERLAYVTGFTGSAGMAIVTPRQSVLFVDGRYVEQAKKQSSFKVLHVPKQTTISDWFAQFLRSRYVVAYDPWTHSVAQVEAWSEIFAKRGAKLVPFDKNPIDKFWLDRPKAPKVITFSYPQKYAGKTTGQKVSPLKKVLKQKEWDAFVLANADTVSWLLNKRSNAVNFHPAFLGRLIVWADGHIVPFDAENVKELKGKVVALDKFETPIKVKQDVISAGASVHHLKNPLLAVQAVKNKTEVAGMRKACLADSVALCEFLAGLSADVSKENELSVLQRLESLRRRDLLYRQDSFAPISAVGKNAALPHYEPTEKKAAKLSAAPIYLLDTGAQYWCGTTDMTRTVATGKVSDLMKRRYTQVLKGHIALAQASFPKGTTGGNLDILARQFLWTDGVDYDHGTGHGVGCFLNVHEVPPSISPRNNDALQPNMVVTNEPGFYLKGKFGIRIENMMLVQKDKQKRAGFLKFEMLTFVPFCNDLIDTDMLTSDEKSFISNYMVDTLEKVYPFLTPRAKEWMKKQVQKWVSREMFDSIC